MKVDQKSTTIILIVVLLYGFFVIYNYITNPLVNIKNIYNKNNIIPVAIIGSGPAGLTAALYTARAHMPTIVFTGLDVGGQLTEARFVENWPAQKKETGMNIMKDLEDQVQRFGAALVQSTVKKIDFSQWPYMITLDNGDVVYALSVIVATGGHQKKLNIPGVEQYWSKGIGICSICDAPFDKGKDVAILGKTDITADMALQLKEFAKTVYVLVPTEKMQAAAITQQYLKEAHNVKLLFNVFVKEIKGDGQQVTGVEIEDTKTHDVRELPIQSFYFAIGFKPSSELFKDQLAMVHKGYIKVNERLQTSKPLVYAAGTIIDRIYQKGLISAAMGAQAAIQLIEDLQNSGFTDKVEEELRSSFYKKDEIQSPIEQLSKLEEIDTELRNGLVVIEFYGENCALCKEIAPLYKQAAESHQDKIKFLKADIQENNDVIDRYDLKQIPTFIIYKNGKELERLVDISKQEELTQFIEKNLN